MILCHCRSVTDRDVAAAHAAGARTLADVARASGAARDCGGCRPALAEALATLACTQVEERDALPLPA